MSSKKSARRDDTHLSDFLRNLSIELNSKDLEELRLRLLAFDNVEAVLDSLVRDDKIQVYRGADVVEDYKRSRQEKKEPIKYQNLDYIIRKNNVELQLEVNLPPSNGFSVDTENIKQYYRVLEANPRTEEIVVVWFTEELDSIAFDFSEIRHYFIHIKDKEESIKITPDRLNPLVKTITLAFEKYRPLFHKMTDIRDIKKIEFDLSEAFSNSLTSHLDELKSSAKRRKVLERRLAIQSITDDDAQQMQRILSESLLSDLDFDDLELMIRAISEDVEIE